MNKQNAIAKGTSQISQTKLFTSGVDGYHTYRIPALIVATDGTILAFCEGRKNSARDDGDIDIVLKRSFDNGSTWQGMQIIVADGDNTMGNPCPVVDRDTGVIWLPLCKNNDQVYIMKSENNGATWSNPMEITKDVKLPSWGWYATGPGHGIQIESGRLVIPCDHRENNILHSHLFYSDDHGGCWKLGGVLGEYTNECEVVQTRDGSLYINMRSYKGNNRRAYAWSKDGGITWSEVFEGDTLIEPVCQASIVRYDENRVLFSNPASTKREKMTVRVSYDECRTWTVSKVLNPGPSGYSNLAVASDMTICCLYERGESDYRETITFAQFNIEWLTNGAD